jgi:hypothetical protein
VPGGENGEVSGSKQFLSSLLEAEEGSRETDFHFCAATVSFFVFPKGTEFSLLQLATHCFDHQRQEFLGFSAATHLLFLG